MGKGDLTRQAIVEHALAMASRIGLEGLSIGGLAQDLHLSKSGLFAHFQSKQALQLQVLEAATRQFTDVVVRPALTAPRGEPRVRALFDRWLAWAQGSRWPGGCVLIAASVEFDDQPGAVRDFIAGAQKDWFDTLAQAVRIAIGEGHFRAELDPEQFAFEAYGIALAMHHTSRLLKDPRAEQRAREAFEARVAAARRTPEPRSNSRE